MSTLKVVVVQCGNEEYAIAIDVVVSIELLEQVNPIPHLPDYMLGLTRIRGELVPILDFEQILYNNSARDNKDARIVVVQVKNLFIGLLVIDAKEILDIPVDKLTSSALAAYSTTPYLTTVANLDDRIITIVDPNILSETLTGMDAINEYVEAQLSKKEG